MRAAKTQHEIKSAGVAWQLTTLLGDMHIVHEPTDYEDDVERILEEEEDERQRRKVIGAGGGKLTEEEIAEEVTKRRIKRHKDKLKAMEEERKRKVAAGVPRWRQDQIEAARRKKKTLYAGIKSIL